MPKDRDVDKILAEPMAGSRPGPWGHFQARPTLVDRAAFKVEFDTEITVEWQYDPECDVFDIRVTPGAGVRLAIPPTPVVWDDL